MCRAQQRSRTLASKWSVEATDCKPSSSENVVCLAQGGTLPKTFSIPLEPASEKKEKKSKRGKEKKEKDSKRKRKLAPKDGAEAGEAVYQAEGRQPRQRQLQQRASCCRPLALKNLSCSGELQVPLAGTQFTAPQS